MKARPSELRALRRNFAIVMCSYSKALCRGAIETAWESARADRNKAASVYAAIVRSLVPRA